MKTKLLALAFLLHPSSFLLAQGPLAPPGAPAPTMKTLDQIEPRTPISSAPFTISASGSYYLTGNLTVATGNAITISADQVTLDLNGFSISSTHATGNGTAVSISGTRRNVTVKNGHLRGTTTFAAGVFTPGGFLDGVSNISFVGANLRVSDLNILGMASDGINLALTSVPTYVVERCNVTVCAALGIQAGLVRDCSADTTGDDAIQGDTVTNCSGATVNTASASGSGIQGLSVVENCRGIAVSGNGVASIVVTNSRGTSTSGIGLSAVNAMNCEGISTSGSFGLAVISTSGIASFCRGQRNGGVALTAFNAIGCSVLGSGTVSATNKSLGTP